MQKFKVIDKNNITGIILAGGKSRRMGMEKGLVKLHGKPLIEYSIDALKPLAGRILISSNSNAYDHYPYEVVPDLIPDSGPMGGIYSGLKKSKTEINLVLSCDTPYVGTELFDLLIKSSIRKDCVIPWHGAEHYEPLCALYNKKITPVFHEFIVRGNFRIPDLYKEVEVLPLMMDEKISFYHEDYFFNINSKQELRRAGEK